VSSGKQHCDRSTHGITHGDDSLHTECRTDSGGIVGAIFQTEIDIRAQTPTVPTMINADDMSEIAQFLISSKKVEVTRGSPTMQQHHRGSIRIGVNMVADEKLTAKRDGHQSRG
jgi:hypothetical protein